MATKYLVDLVTRYQNETLVIEQQLAGVLMRSFSARVRPITRILKDIADAAALIDPADVNRWLREDIAARSLMVRAQRDMDIFARFAAEQIEARKRELIALAIKHDESLTYAALIGEAQVTPATAQALRFALSSIPVDAVIAQVGALGVGSPLRAWVAQFGKAAGEDIAKTLIAGVTRGRGARDIARRLRTSLEGNASRALTTARTETLRSYRAASLHRYNTSPQVFAGWEWYANLDRRTCPVCIAMHGQIFSADTEFATHPNCRCRPVPVPQSVASILGDSPEAARLQSNIDAAQQSPTGEEWFSALDADTQRGIVGNAKHAAMTRGEISLQDMVRESSSAWGEARSTASLAQAVVNAAG